MSSADVVPADLKQRLGALYATLAEATKACPESHAVAEEVAARAHPQDRPYLPSCCQGTGDVARFPEFRQACWRCKGQCRLLKSFLANREPTDEDFVPCFSCNGIGWQVCAGGLADGLAGLNRPQTVKVLRDLMDWMGYGYLSDPMPDRDTILVKALELICKAAGLEVPDA